TRLGVVLGANPATFSGLSGLGDLIVTCDSRHSRNRHVGEAIGKGKSLKDILAESPMIAEGVATTESAYELAQRHGVEMPIVEQVYQILFFNKSPRLAIHELMTRESKSEVQ
ncbi:MAG: glycerol 3-phosphate dehydrogenase, partial [Bacteroidota bacterium]